MAASAVFVRSTARADDPAPACGPDLVVGLEARDADEIVSATCSAIAGRSTPGPVRVGIVSSGRTISLTVSRVVDEEGRDRALRADVDSKSEAVRLAPLLARKLFGDRVVATPRPAPPLLRSGQTTGTFDVGPTLPSADKAQPPTPKPQAHGVFGAQGGLLSLGVASKHYSDPEPNAGIVGGLVAIEYSRLFAFADLTYAGNSALTHVMGSFGMRAYVLRSTVSPVIGGGVAYTSSKFLRTATAPKEEKGFSTFIDAGLVVRVDGHRIGGVVRLQEVGVFDRGRSSGSSTSAKREESVLVAAQLFYAYAF